MAHDAAFVDDYLSKWDRFAQGENHLVPEIRERRADFEAALARMLRGGDRAAPGRMVFYAAVQVAGGIPVESELGQAATGVLGADFPVTTTNEGDREYFAGSLYSWWVQHESMYEPYDLFEEWSSRDFARNNVIPMFERLAQSESAAQQGNEPDGP